MSTKDPGVWVAIFAWLSQHSQVIYAAVLSISISALRIVYRGGTCKAVLLESVLCGCITLAIISGLSIVGLSQAASAFVGGMVGLLGVEKIRQLAERFAGVKFPRQ